MRPKLIHTLSLFVLSVFLSASVIGQDLKDKSITSTQAENTIKLKIKGINCGGDILDIQKQVSELKGVTSCIPAKKPAATTIFEVKFNPALVSEKEIRDAVEGTPGCSDPEARPYKVKI